MPHLLADGCCNASNVLVALGKHSHIRDGQLQGPNTLLLSNQTCTAQLEDGKDTAGASTNKSEDRCCHAHDLEGSKLWCDP